MLMELKEAEDSSKHLEVCYSHFVFDQNKLHDEGTKKLNSIDYDSFKHLRICIFCNKRKWIVDRGIIVKNIHGVLINTIFKYLVSCYI